MVACALTLPRVVYAESEACPPAQTVFRDDQLINPNCTIALNLANLYVKSVRVGFLIAFLTLVWIGYLYITSLGNQEKVNQAKTMLGKLIVGVILLLLLPLLMANLSGSRGGGDEASDPPAAGTPVPEPPAGAPDPGPSPPPA